MLNTPMAVLVVLVVVVAVNAFLFFGHYLLCPASGPPTAASSAPTLTTERTRSAPMRTTVENEFSEIPPSSLPLSLHT